MIIAQPKLTYYPEEMVDINFVVIVPHSLISQVHINLFILSSFCKVKKYCANLKADTIMIAHPYDDDIVVIEKMKVELFLFTFKISNIIIQRMGMDWS